MIENREEYEKAERKKRKRYLSHLNPRKAVAQMEDLLSLVDSFPQRHRSQPIALKFLLRKRP